MLVGLLIIISLSYFANTSYVCEALEANVDAVRGPISREIYLDNLTQAKAILSERLMMMKSMSRFLEGEVSSNKIITKSCTSSVFFTSFNQPLSIGDSVFGHIRITSFNYLFLLGLAVYIIIFFAIWYLLKSANRDQLSLIKQQIISPIIQLSKTGELSKASSITEIQTIYSNLHELHAFMQANTKIKAELEFKEQFFISAKQVAHDIRSPVTALLSAAQLIQSKPEESSQLIRMAAERVDRIANDLLKSSKEKHTTNSELFNSTHMPQQHNSTAPEISKLIKEIVSEKRMEYFNNSDIIINDIIHENNRAVLSAPHFDLKRILSNLINNSVEASCGKNVISIVARVSDKNTNITITDQGVGIRPTLLSNLNDEFDKTPITTKEFGHGLGLKSSKAEIQKIGGQFNIRSKEGIGTIVEIQVPTQLLVDYPFVN